VRQLGLVGAMLAATQPRLGDTRSRRFYETAQRLNVMLGIHASASPGRRRRRALPAVHPGPHLLARVRTDAPAHLGDLRGIPSGFPISIAFLEAGGGWRPTGWTDDDEYAKRAPEAPALKKKPRSIVRSGKIYFSCEADEWLLGPP